jgi:hypothetical protein
MVPSLQRPWSPIWGASIAYGMLTIVLCIALVVHPRTLHAVAPESLATPIPAPAAVIAVPLDASSRLNQMVLGTNLTATSEVLAATNPAHGAPLLTWQPMLRLHLGYTGDEIVLPDTTYGHWDMTKVDAAVARLRAANVPFYFNVRTGPPWMYDSRGQLRDQSYQEFAQFMARLVGWYNKGGFTDELGRYHASGHLNWISTWEIWNEPNSGYDIPLNVSHPSATWLYATEFAHLYSVTSTAMRAVDPTIHTGGPAISSYPDDRYIVDFINNVTAPLDFFSCHFYAIGSQRAPDAEAFTATTGAFAHRLALARSALDARFPDKAIPIWVDEVGFNEIAVYPVDPRGAASVGVAFAATSFVIAAQHEIGQFIQFPFLGNAQLALVDNKTQQPYVPLRFYQVLARTFPAGVRILPSTLTSASGLQTIAAIAPDGKSLRVLIANTAVAAATDVNGHGIPTTVRVRLAGAVHGLLPHAGEAATAWTFDATTDATKPAPSHPLPIFADDGGTLSVQTPLAGYGVAIIQIPLR